MQTTENGVHRKSEQFHMTGRIELTRCPVTWWRTIQVELCILETLVAVYENMKSRCINATYIECGSGRYNEKSDAATWDKNQLMTIKNDKITNNSLQYSGNSVNLFKSSARICYQQKYCPLHLLGNLGSFTFAIRTW
ncbi:hypothetical protein BDR07DRAFT_191018 [Suillus spraguei]|nr:hypothetical protein BDR07DRAFT_191018 [Suillus spraguei]